MYDKKNQYTRIIFLEKSRGYFVSGAVSSGFNPGSVVYWVSERAAVDMDKGTLLKC